MFDCLAYAAEKYTLNNILLFAIYHLSYLGASLCASGFVHPLTSKVIKVATVLPYARYWKAFFANQILLRSCDSDYRAIMCGVIGLILGHVGDDPNSPCKAAMALHEALYFLQHRGQDG